MAASKWQERERVGGSPGQVRRFGVVDRLTGKSGKQEVDYRPAPSGYKASCAECIHFLNPGQETSSCRRVAGVVEGRDLCDLFTARETEAGEQGQPVNIQVSVHSS